MKIEVVFASLLLVVCVVILLFLFMGVRRGAKLGVVCVFCGCVSLFVGWVGAIGWLRQTCGALKVACASLGWDEVGWSGVVCAGKDVSVFVHLFQEEPAIVCDLTVLVVLS